MKSIAHLIKCSKNNFDLTDPEAQASLYQLTDQLLATKDLNAVPGVLVLLSKSH